jgi:hypothetical protein
MKKLLLPIMLLMLLAGCSNETSNSNVSPGAKTEKPVTIEVQTRNPGVPKDIDFNQANTAFAYRSSLFDMMGKKKNEAGDALHIILGNFSTSNPADYGKSSDISASKWAYDDEFSPKAAPVKKGEFVLDIYLVTRSPKIGAGYYTKNGTGPFLAGDTGFLAFLVTPDMARGEFFGSVEIKEITDSKVSGEFNLFMGATGSDEEIKVKGKFTCPVVSEQNISSVKKF